MVVPSEWYENSPYAVLEAMGAGKPVIAANLGGLPDLVVEGETGLLFPPGDIAALAGCMARLRNDPAAAAAMGRNARRKIENEYSEDAHYAALLHAYAEAGSRRKTRAQMA